MRLLSFGADMQRRDFITLLGGAAVLWPHAAWAQQHPVSRVGIIISLTATDPQATRRVTAFKQGLAEHGRLEGQNLEIVWKWAAGDPEAFKRAAAELVEIKPDVIVVASDPGTKAVSLETKSIPVVFLIVTDPIGQGFAESFARPAKNFTGFTSFEPQMFGKWIELLKQVSPSINHLVAMYNPETTAWAFLPGMKAAAEHYSMSVVELLVRDSAEIKAGFSSIKPGPDVGLIFMPDIFTIVHREQIIAEAARTGLAAIYPYGYFVKSGGLLAYGVDTTDLYRRAGAYAARILKGEKAGELPIQAPTKFELVINLKTAKALGLTVPPSLLATADEVIE
jgi:putative ABC transport system substrate-binding protein